MNNLTTDPGRQPYELIAEIRRCLQQWDHNRYRRRADPALYRAAADLLHAVDHGAVAVILLPIGKQLIAEHGRAVAELDGEPVIENVPQDQADHMRLVAPWIPITDQEPTTT